MFIVEIKHSLVFDAVISLHKGEKPFFVMRLNNYLKIGMSLLFRIVMQEG